MSLNKNQGALDPRIADQNLMRKMASLKSFSTSSSRKQSGNQQLPPRPLPRSDSRAHKTPAQKPDNHPYTATQSQTPPQKTPTTYNRTPHTVTKQSLNYLQTHKQQLPNVAQTQNVQRTQTTLQELSTQTHNPSHVQQFHRRFVSDVVGAVDGSEFIPTRKSSLPLASGPSVSSASAQLAAPEKNLIYDALLRIEEKMTLFDTRLQNLEELATKIYTMTKRETKKKSMVRKDRPAFLPFSTKEDLLFFDDASEDDYNAFVSHFIDYNNLDSFAILFIITVQF
ncbi:uncharacterized protein LOC116416110 [Nasonia vitripennis]|uniref:Uncharacterized protein n=1 Tax=Nasonia vitripennis TaxID=7425 RepID=A0A7M7Q297_NASVI|nr:uncharacterized protein LOC116416110 [Nasonia vitripennis]